jgi:phasin family protein
MKAKEAAMANVPASKGKKIVVDTASKPAVKATPVVAAKAVTKSVAPPVVTAPVAAPSPKIVAAPAPKIVAAPVAVAKAVAAPALVITPQPVPAATPAPTAVEGSTKMTDTINKIEDTVKTTTAQVSEKATEMFHDVSAKAKTAMDKASETAKDAMEFNKLNLEAVVEAGKIAFKGAQTATQNAADLGRKNLEETTAMVKSISGVKAPADFFKIQGDFARSQFDAAVAEMSKSSEFYLKLAGEVFQPISTRYSVAADAVKARMAA